MPNAKRKFTVSHAYGQGIVDIFVPCESQADFDCKQGNPITLEQAKEIASYLPRAAMMERPFPWTLVKDWGTLLG